MENRLLFLLFFCIANLSLAQDFIINGNVVDAQQEPIGYANILLLAAADSTFVLGAVSEENGSFSFASVKQGKYLLKGSFVGFLDNFSAPFEVEGSTEAPLMILQNDHESLDEVIIITKKPTIRKEIDRLVFNVENTVVSSGTTYDIIRRTPGVIVSQNQILVKNRPAQVYINDRRVYLTAQELQQLLEGFSGENVKSVEVITNPPAKYDAEGGAILNIVTSKNISIGYKGSVNASNTQARVPKYSFGTSQFYKNDWLNAFASYNFNTRKDNKLEESRIRFFEPDGSTNSNWETDFDRTTRTNSHSLNSILDFTIDEKNTLSVSANLLYTPKSDSDIGGLTEIYGPQAQLDSLFTTQSQLLTEGHNYLFNLNYTRQLGENGASISTQANYINYKDEQQQDVATRYTMGNGDLLNENSFRTFPIQNSDIYTGQVDYSGALGSFSLESGVKYSGIDSESRQIFFNIQQQNPQFIGALSDFYDYRENIYAAYASISRDWDKWSLQLGLRGEYTDVSGNSLSLGQVNTQEYFEPFPTFYLMHMPNDTHSFGFSYSRRIDRPRFQSLNPFRTFINENNFNQGNPNIQPAITNNITLNYTFKNKLSFDLYYDHTDAATAVLPFQNNQNRTLQSITTNMDYSRQYSFDISYNSFPLDWYYLSIYSSFFNMENQFTAIESGAQQVKTDVNGAFLQTVHSFTLDKEGTFSTLLTTYYMTDYISGSYHFDESQLGVNLGVRKVFFDDRLVATIDFDDIFNQMNIPLSSRYLNQDNSFFARPESRMVRFGLRYNFGNFKLSDNERASTTEESERLKEQGIMDRP
ncbi:outer membrane beta-barrel family protein [Flavimarina sp. Hel_I_48]|uniref:outer membrane beta-barrel family protein n=1 Tax=Flavimarina sp. Hel_I_48 TaxID=1392488 RepID=UPI0004DFAA7D|nr:outer membrane beta-barrel family protein [Flavimarina sp. Hel_I_48]